MSLQDSDMLLHTYTILKRLEKYVKNIFNVFYLRRFHIKVSDKWF
jgi:hypothetical protein